jgi:hypothetical protein
VREELGGGLFELTMQLELAKETQVLYGDEGAVLFPKALLYIYNDIYHLGTVSEERRSV